MPPRRVGPWEIRSVLGRGGVGIVYRARHERTRAPAAVKLLGPAPLLDRGAACRLAREYDVLRSLDHPHVVRAYEAGEEEGWAYLAMELVEGLDLRTFLSPRIDDADRLAAVHAGAVAAEEEPAPPAGEPDPEEPLAGLDGEPITVTGFHQMPAPHPGPRSPHPPLAPDVAAALNRPCRVTRLRTALAQVLAALAYLHRRGLVHRDLKPANIMVDDLRRARLMDFGLAVAAGGTTPPAPDGLVAGTYRYMSPEQAQGRPLDGRSDLYSLGVILYELLAAQPPFAQADPGALWHEILNEPPAPLASLNPGVDPGLAAVAERCLAKDPARRFQRAEDVLAALLPPQLPPGPRPVQLLGGQPTA